MHGIVAADSYKGQMRPVECGIVIISVQQVGGFISADSRVNAIMYFAVSVIYREFKHIKPVHAGQEMLRVG